MRRWLLLSLAALTVLGARPAAAGEVDLQLVLAVDSSSSVSMDEYYLQLEGYAAAFRHPDLLKAIQSGPRQAIAVALFEWAGVGRQKINFAWRRLDDAASLEAFAAELAAAPRLVLGGDTAIGEAIDFALDLLDRAEVRGARRVIDISGDGISNRGRSPDAARDDAVFRGVTVNGLAILNEEPDVDTFYGAFVIGGPGAFLLTARDYSDFAEAIVKKLVREVTTIAELPPGAR
jgi:hypothetical protein